MVVLVVVTVFVVVEPVWVVVLLVVVAVDVAVVVEPVWVVVVTLIVFVDVIECGLPATTSLDVWRNIGMPPFNSQC